jgi:hypothetical protein
MNPGDDFDTAAGEIGYDVSPLWSGPEMVEGAPAIFRPAPDGASSLTTISSVSAPASNQPCD